MEDNKINERGGGGEFSSAGGEYEDVSGGAAEETEYSSDEEKINFGDTINIKSVFDRFKRKAVETGEEVLRAVSGSAAAEKEDTDAAEADTEEIVIDIEEIKQEISRTIEASMDTERLEKSVREALDNAENAQLKELESRLSDVSDGLENIKRRFQAMQQSVELGMNSNINRIELLNKSVETLKAQTGEIAQTVSGVTKLSDSVFDLKNSQVNTKNSIEALSSAVKSMKKKLTLGAAVFSVIAVVIAILQIITLLS